MTYIVLFVFIVLLFWFALRSKKKHNQVKAITCPRCKAVNTFEAKPCDNCGSNQTVVERQHDNDATPLIQRCLTCKTVSAVSTQCSSCGTDLRGLLGGGFAAAALKGAKDAQSFNSRLK